MSGVADAIGNAAVGEGIADEGTVFGPVLGATVAEAPEQPATTKAMSNKRRIEVLP
jgi:hypothetical protein